MPGFLGGGSSGSSGAGGEITFPKEFVDPVTKLRVSNPQNLIDTDFEYGLQPTKWETVELINNTPSFFSKSGDTTIPGITAITTNAGTREITVKTSLEHGLAAAIPIQVTGTKSVTADGSYIINSIPNPNTFTYLCRDDQPITSSIEDLYSSIITGEFFQGSQLRVADSSGITTDGASISTLTVRTESTHGFGIKTPFYFLNLNSTISQEFQASNTAAKSFDASNSATAQTFDGSNTLSSIPVDWSNSATIGGASSSISSVSVSENTITVAHGVDNFFGLPLGTPLYYSVTPAVGYFGTNPRGVVFLKTVDNLGQGVSTFQVSEVPNGAPISIESSLSGFFKVANQARTFAGNNTNPETQIDIEILEGQAFSFEALNDGGLQTEGDITSFSGGNPNSTVVSYSGSLINVSVSASAGLGYYTGAMVFYSTTGSAASGLTNNTTYFVDSFFPTGTDTFAFTIKQLPNAETAISISGGTGTQTFKRIGLSFDKDIVHVRNANFVQGEMLQYNFPANGQFGTESAADQKQFYFVATAYDAHNFQLNAESYSPLQATGGTVTQITQQGRTYNIHAFTTVGSSTFTVLGGETDELDVLIVAGGGGGGAHVPGGGGAGGLIYRPGLVPTPQAYPITVGAGGLGSFNPGGYTGQPNATAGGNSTAFGLTALGGGWGLSWFEDLRSANGGSGGGREGRNGSRGIGLQPSQAGDSGAFGFGNSGGNGIVFANDPYPGSGGGGAGGEGLNQVNLQTAGAGGPGRYYGDKFGDNFGESGWFAGGGGGGSWGFTSGGRGAGGIGGGGAGDSPTGNGTGTSARGAGNTPTGVSGLANTGGGGGGAGKTGGEASRGGNGGTGVVIIRYPVTPPLPIVPAVATGGTVSDVTIGSIIYRVHAFTSVGSSSFQVQSTGGLNEFNYAIVAGGGGGGGWGGGGGAGGLRTGVVPLTPGTTYTIIVGAGGERGFSGPYRAGSDGAVSSAFGIVSTGGGGGGFYNANVGRPGGSGGGGAMRELNQGTPGGAGGAGIAGQGFAGGTAGVNNNGSWNTAYGGGGGGAGGPGNTGFNRAAPSGNGGVGRNLSTLFGTSYGENGWFAGGGGGHSGVNFNDRLAAGGLGGGGRGGRNSSEAGATGALPGSPNTGGGGGSSWGGDSSPAGAGGSGIVLISYPIARVEE